MTIAEDLKSCQQNNLARTPSGMARQAIRLKIIDLSCKCGDVKFFACEETFLYLGPFAIGKCGIKLVHCHNSQKRAGGFPVSGKAEIRLREGSGSEQIEDGAGVHGASNQLQRRI
jgi:hypothetical protein